MKGRRILSLLVCLWLLFPLCGTALADESYAETPLAAASAGQASNARLAAQSIDGMCLAYGDRFSFNETVGARTEERGYVMAANGRGVNVVGGGVARAATTLYLALTQRDDIEYTSIYTYNENFTEEYVSSGYDAIAVDYSNGLDFAFTSFCPSPLTIYMWEDENESLCCYIVEGAEAAAEEAALESGFAQTPAYGSPAQVNNLTLAAAAIDGCRVGPGEVFSFNGVVGPRTVRDGYQMAENGRGAEVVGGGVAQVASTVYLAVRGLRDVVILEKQTYGNAFRGRYVEDGESAILVDYTGGIDFSFAWQGSGDLVLYAYLQEGMLVCEAYVE